MDAHDDDRLKNMSELDSSPFRAIGPIMLRSPLLSVSEFVALIDSADSAEGVDLLIADQSSEGPYNSALRIGSPSLHSSISSPARNEKAGRRRSSALYRFFARASARPTPYGAFAGVGLGSIGHGTRLVRAQELQLSARPDAGWLVAAGETITTPDKLPSRHLIPNPQLIIAGGRVILPYADTTGSADDRHVDIRMTEAVELALELCDGSAGLDGVIQRIMTRNPNYPGASVEKLMRTLLDLHVITPNSLVRTGSKDQAELLRSFASTTDSAGLIHHILDSSRALSLLTARTAADVAAIEAEQSKVYAGKSGETLQVDAALKLHDATVDESIIDQIANAVTAISALTPTRRSPQMEEYHTRCVERYGIYAEIPLKELLSEESGVGPPNDYMMPRAKAVHPIQGDSQTTEWQSISSRLVAESLMDGSGEVDVKYALTIMQPRKQNHRIAPTLDVFASFDSPQQDAGDRLIILSTDGVAEGGRTFGRFLHLLDDSAAEQLRNSYEATYPRENFQLAEVRYLPTSGRAANVTMVPPLTESEIVVNVAPTRSGVSLIDLNDILVYLADENFSFRVRGEARELKAVQSHMLNTLMAPNPLRFLIEATQEASGAAPYLDMRHFSSLAYVPRFVYENVVVRVARWHLRHVDQIASRTAYDSWRERYKVPRYVYLTEADNRLLLDLDSDVGQRELVRAMEQRTEGTTALILEECLPLPGSTPLVDQAGEKYMFEIVVPLTNTSYRAERLIVDSEARRRQELTRETIVNRAQGVGDTWTSFRVYAGFSRHDEILLRVISPAMEAKGFEWFYVEYADPFPHIRLRVRTEGSELLLNELIALLSEARRERIISRFDIGTYDREIERYGGYELISAAETLFYASSSYSVKAIDLARTGKIEREWLTILALEQTASPWLGAITVSDARPKIDDSIRRRFYQASKDLTELIAPWRGGPSAENRKHLEDELEELSLASDTFARLVVAKRDEGQLVNSPESILGSVLHMQCNRLLVGDRTTEDQVMHLWSLTRDAISRRPATAGAYGS